MSDRLRRIHDIGELQSQVRCWRAAGERIALVPTMGCLHAGHLRLVEVASKHADRVVVSIFVNPLQFAAGEDLDRYPRTLDADCDALAATPCAVVFAPEERALYPRGRDGLTVVQVPEISARYCGAFRAGHFEGVTTVVNILLNLVQPDVAVFGEKDWQQLFLIRRMVRDLWLPVEIVGVPTVREADGLAMSSRNRYLDAPARAQAAHFPRILEALVADLQAQPQVPLAPRLAQAVAALQEQGLHAQYLDLVTDRFAAAQELQAGEYQLLAAVEVGLARLIDNRRVVICASETTAAPL